MRRSYPRTRPRDAERLHVRLSVLATDDALVADLANAISEQRRSDISGQCSDALSSRRGIPLAAVIPGVLLLIGSGVMIVGAKVDDDQALEPVE
jgi:hypothetical protein